MIYLINTETQAGTTLAEKIAIHGKTPEAVISLSNDEMEAARGMIVINPDAASNQSIVEVKPGASYIMVIDSLKTNIDDIKCSAKYIGCNIGIVRTR